MSKRDQYLRQIETLVASHELRGSDSLCKLLRYLAQHSLNHSDEPIKEYGIATEVFGRSADFDPQLDSIIRVQAGRLRSKLAKYYETEGANDPILVELPKGTYHLSFHQRTKPSPTLFEAAPAVPATQPAGWLTPARSRIAVTILSILLLLSIALIAALLASRKPSDLSSGLEARSSPARAAFWRPFTSGPEDPWVVFSNASFVGRPETGLRYYDPARDPKSSVWDHYTGVGEVLAVHAIGQVFASLHRGLRVKRGSLFTLDDVQNNNLIFLGSPSENLTLMDIPNTREFVFQRVASGPRKGDLALVSVHPGPGEPAENLASPSSAPLTEDFAVVALLPGLNSSRSVMILAGTTTFGTQGAAEFVCRESSVRNLLLRLTGSETGELKPFESLLRVKVTRGVPIQSEIVAIRKRTSP